MVWWSDIVLGRCTAFAARLGSVSKVSDGLGPSEVVCGVVSVFVLVLRVLRDFGWEGGLQSCPALSPL